MFSRHAMVMETHIYGRRVLVSLIGSDLKGKNTNAFA